MDYDVSLSEDGKYIQIRLHKPMTNELGRRCGIDAKALGEQSGINRFLFDLRGAPNIESATANYQFAHQDLGEFGFPKTSRSVLLTDPDDLSHNFMETLILNAGYQVQIFSCEITAIKWLKG